ncbi:MAG: 30S ribosomal protein S13 [Nanoarchaeota archaeon]|nr:30S ribosomal protein S13 [Nanoarchaeota archaeon]MBU4242081.1 30S ribosomal protein S13 [Nanoarchaeota archaeon]MBU4351995.1 30S ribosomal protein S13 [Nanoarchaeota archaeon]MBU4455966.1 30S ribosomal protein S13 [Nanoarchaeota archaeon]MCG2720321.1 30S ribosomal protein S13 [Nanoarchaeota archaeon]
MTEEKNQEQNIRQMVRLISADVLGNKSIYLALQKVRGVGFSLAGAICNIMQLDKNTKIGILTEEQIKKLEGIIKNPSKHGIPGWLLNRRKDYETGEDKHLITADLKLKVEDDVKRLKKIKAYRGMRHAAGLPTRGQRTKGHFRKGKSLGVSRKKAGKAGK